MRVSVSLCLIHLHSTVKLHEFLKQPSEQRALCQLLAPSIPLSFFRHIFIGRGGVAQSFKSTLTSN